jgi:hypothetical protein
MKAILAAICLFGGAYLLWMLGQVAPLLASILAVGLLVLVGKIIAS